MASNKYSSRKLWLGAAFALLIAGLGILSAFVIALGPNLGVLVGGIVGVYAVYCTGSAASKYVTGNPNE